jgi:4-diphosphocytidyl-2-C-methyl-D-erythritol kinase
MINRPTDREMINITARAKLNLFLAVKRLRADGYHEVETVYQAVEMHDANGNCVADELLFAPRSHGIDLTVDPPRIPVDQRNLCWRAAQLLQERANTQDGVYLRLRKHLPIGAGLGGGSSDAAATLIGLNTLWQSNLSATTLCRYAADLGSDVPFFLHGGTAVGRGRGETLESLDTPDLAFVIAWPGIYLSTPDVYRTYDELPAKQGVELPAMLEAIQTQNPRTIANALRNDLEEPACQLRPEIIEPLEYLTHRGMLGVQVTGSGSAVFGIAESHDHAAEIALAMAADLHIWVCSARSIPVTEYPAFPSSGVQYAES